MKVLTFAIIVAAVGAVGFLAQANDEKSPSAPKPVSLRAEAVVPDEDARPKVDKAEDDKDEDSAILTEFMQQKLDASSRILRGLMVDDFRLIEKNAEQLLKMSHAEKWRASNDMMYLQHSTQFRNAVDELRQKAKKQSPDGASLAWINVTMSCIQCHQWVRNVVLADLDEE